MKQTAMMMLFLFCAAVIFTQDASQNGIITEITGTVELKAVGQTNFSPARTGDAVAANTIVSTGFKSTALIRAGSAVLTVRPLTRLTLAEIRNAAGIETINVSLQTGRVRVDVTPPAGTRAAMTITSPVATASVRGTSFEFDTRSITVLSGTVAFLGANGGVMLVSAGSTSEINSNGRSADPAEIFTSALVPPPPAGSDTSYAGGGASVPGVKDFIGDFTIDFKLH